MFSANGLWFGFQIDPVMVAGVGMWAMTLYLACSSWSDRLRVGLQQWLSKSGSTSLDKNRAAIESYAAFWASICSIFPFIGAGVLCYLGLEWGLGTSWAFSFGMMGALISGIYELGRRSQAFD